MVKDFEVSPRITLMFGMDAAIKIRQEGWKEIKKENLIIVAPECTIMKLPQSEKERGKAISAGIHTRFIENMDTKESIEKNLRRKEQGIETRHYPWHGMSIQIRDERIVYLENPHPELERVIVRIENPDFAKKMKEFYEELWEKSTPLEEKLREFGVKI